MSWPEALFQLSLPVKIFSTVKVKDVVEKEINPNKSLSYDLIIGKVLPELPRTAVRMVTCIFNAILQMGLFPCSRKIAVIIMILKTGKDAENGKSYRPVSSCTIQGY